MHVTYHLDMLRRARHNCNVRLSNLYTLTAHSDLKAYNLETMHLSMK